MEMRADEIIGSQVAKARIEGGRTLKIGEEECEAGDGETLIGIERFGAVEVAERLVTQQAL
jgi:hypothetical protein